MDRFPQMLYRVPGHDVRTDSGPCATRVVVDVDDLADALADGWHETSPAAAEAFAATREDAPPTRSELEQKATEIGVKFDGRTSDKKLRDLIAAALEA